MGKHVALEGERRTFVPSETTPRRRRARHSQPAPVVELFAHTPQAAPDSTPEAPARVSLFSAEPVRAEAAEARVVEILPAAHPTPKPVADAEAESAKPSEPSPTETLVGDIEPIRISPADRQDTDELHPDEMLALAFASGVRAAKRQPRRLDPHELERLAAGTVALPIVAEEDRVPLAPVDLGEGETMVLAEPHNERPRRLAQGVAASAVLLAGAGIGLAGMGHGTASASGALTASLVGGTDQEAVVPAALTGSDVAQARSVVKDISAEAATSPMCNTDGASGVRAAYANTKNVLVWPLLPGSYTLTSSFGSRIDPVYHTVRMHAGQDLAGPLGTPVYAAADGVVVETLGTNNMVRIKHEINGETFYTAYLHMYARDILVKAGDTVSAGQRIGAIGNYGKSTGPHLHFETHDSTGTPVEPTAFMKAHGAIQITQMCR